MHVLVADPEDHHRHALVERIQASKHQIATLLVGREIVDACRKQCPDLILIDPCLPGENAIEIVRQIRQTGGHALWVPILLLCQAPSELLYQQAMEAGADDCLQKPVSPGVLGLKLQMAARQVNLKQEVFKVAQDLVVANRHLQTAITQDVLTGLNNSNSFEEALEQEWFTAKRLNMPISLILLNVDFFQLYNQYYGAEEGDQVIKKIADVLKSALPKESFLARTTGETFAILLPNTTGQEAFEIGNSLNKAIDTLAIPHQRSGCSDHVTASFGVATVEPNHFTKPWDLRDAADFGLYQAKHRGRHRGYIALIEEVEPAII